MKTRTAPNSSCSCRVAVTCGLAIPMVLCVSLSSAKPPTELTEATADALFEQGKSALKSGDWPTACTKFRRSHALDPSPSALVKIARCYEHERKPRDAYMAYDAALALISQHHRDSHARELAALIQSAQVQLTQVLGRVTLRWPEAVPKIEVSVDGHAIPASVLAQPIILEPGVHRIDTEAKGYLPAVVELTIAAGTMRELDLTLEPVPNDPQAAAPYPILPPAAVSHAPLSNRDAAQVTVRDPKVPKVASASSKPMPSRGAAALPSATQARGGANGATKGLATTRVGPESIGKGQRTWGVITGATGTALLGVAGYLGWRARTFVDNARVDNHCDANFACDDVGMDRIHSAERAQLQALVTATGGVVLLGTGIALFATAGSQKPQSGGRQLRLLLTPFGTSMEGNF